MEAFRFVALHCYDPLIKTYSESAILQSLNVIMFRNSLGKSSFVKLTAGSPLITIIEI